MVQVNLLLIGLSATVMLQALTVQAVWPYQPYIDVCSGLPKTVCTGFCKWYLDAIPWCYDPKYKAQKPPTDHPNADMVKKFFDFSYGVHLSEGTSQQMYYNMDHIECAKRCLKSAGEPPYVRCLSFDFYPFEDPIISLPYAESAERGICILNSADSRNARLRNVDQYFTDSELFYQSSYLNRPFSNLEGYYEIRNPRGGEISYMLDYDGYGSNLNMNIVWGGSRWGIHHLSDIRELANARQNMTDDEVAEYEAKNPYGPMNIVGFTPVNTQQHCAGMLTKKDAQDLCASVGAKICSSKQQATLLEDRKLGCSYDGDPVWVDTDIPKSGEKKFVRCCGQYSTLIRSSKECKDKFVDIAPYCSSFKTFIDCPSGMEKLDYGFGRKLDNFRLLCKTTGYCRNALVQQWRQRDPCVWCGEATDLDTPNRNIAGSCRPASFGLCPNNSEDPRKLLSYELKAACSKESLDAIGKAYPDFQPLLSAPVNVVKDDVSRCNEINDPLKYVGQRTMRKKACLGVIGVRGNKVCQWTTRCRINNLN